jgi:hypothetical protein
MSKDTGKFNQLVRTAQSVTHRYMPDRRSADRVGYGIADFVVVNWNTVSQDFGRGAEDEIEIVERVARVVVRELLAA